MTVEPSELINYLKKMNKNIAWENAKQSTQLLTQNLLSEPLASQVLVSQEIDILKQALGPTVKIGFIPDGKGQFKITVDTRSLNEELNRREEKVEKLKDNLAQKREGFEARIPPILARGGKAQGFLKRDDFMLTLKQVNFVRKMQLEQALKKGNDSVTNILLSHEKYPKVFGKKDPTILIGDQGKAIMLCMTAPLGQGANGAVYIGQELDTGDFCVVKSLFNTKKEAVLAFSKENKTLEELNLLIDTMQVVESGKNKLYSIQDLAWGRDYCQFLGLETGDHLKVSEIKKLDMLIKALEKIHDMHTKDQKLHRDIKVENIVWDEKTATAKLVDVGLTETMKEGEFIGPVCGTPQYIAPELIKSCVNGEKGVFDKKTEMYAAGILGCEMFSSTNLQLQQLDLFKNLTNAEKGGFYSNGLSNSLKKADIFQPDPNRSKESMELYAYLRKMVDINSTNRPTFENSLFHLRGIQAKMQLQVDKTLQQDKKLLEPNNTKSTAYMNQLDQNINMLNTRIKAKGAKKESASQSKLIKDQLIAVANRFYDNPNAQELRHFKEFGSEISKIVTKEVATEKDLENFSQYCIAEYAKEKMRHLTTRSRPKENESESKKLADSIIQDVNNLLKSTAEYKAGSEIRSRALPPIPPAKVSSAPANKNLGRPLPSKPDKSAVSPKQVSSAPANKNLGRPLPSIPDKSAVSPKQVSSDPANQNLGRPLPSITNLPPVKPAESQEKRRPAPPPPTKPAKGLEQAPPLPPLPPVKRVESQEKHRPAPPPPTKPAESRKPGSPVPTSPQAKPRAIPKSPITPMIKEFNKINKGANKPQAEPNKPQVEPKKAQIKKKD